MQHAGYGRCRVSLALPGNAPAAANPCKPALFRRAVIINLLTQTQCTQPSSHPLRGTGNNAVVAITLMQLSPARNFITAPRLLVFRERRGKRGLPPCSRTPGPRARGRQELLSLLGGVVENRAGGRSHVPRRRGRSKPVPAGSVAAVDGRAGTPLHACLVGALPFPPARMARMPTERCPA